MGLFSDYIETAQERWIEQSIKDQWATFVNTLPTHSIPPSPQYVCPLCHSSFSDDAILQDHVADKHGKFVAYIILDSRVVTPLEATPTRPQQLMLVCRGGNTRVDLTVGRDSTTFLVDEGTTSLLDHVPLDFAGLIHIETRNPGGARSYSITIGEAPKIRYAEIRNLAASLQASLDSGIEPDWNGYTKLVQQKYLHNPYEKNFLDAFFDYSLGFWMERNGDTTHSASHLERALAQLEPYRQQPMALTASRILGTRLNCFSTLRAVPRDSRFYFAKLFFIDSALSLPATLDQKSQEPNMLESVYCDGFTERFLVILKSFYAKDFRNVIRPCQQLKAEAADDRNNNDKIDLVLARACRLNDDHSIASKHYRALQDHPDYHDEATAFLRGRSQGR